MSISKISKKIIQKLHGEIESYHDEINRGLATTIYLKNKKLPSKKQTTNIIILNIRYFTENGLTINGTKIQKYVNFETVRYEFEYCNNDNKYLIKNCEIQDEYEINWDDLPREVIENLESFCKSEFDDEFFESLEEWYEGLDNIKLQDFPKVLEPHLKQIIGDFKINNKN